jgi:uncharacterized RDD family membrane protein YckC
MDGKTLRFINFLIDTAIYITIMISFIVIFGNMIEKKNIKWISLVSYFLYYFISEYTKGQSIGKIITHCKVISISENKRHFFIQILLRTLMRFIPLDILSYLITYRGLHDWISQTTIITKF